MLIKKFKFDQIQDGDILCMAKRNDGYFPTWKVEGIDHNKRIIGKLKIVTSFGAGYANGGPFKEKEILIFATALYKEFTSWKDRYSPVV